MKPSTRRRVRSLLTLGLVLGTTSITTSVVYAQMGENVSTSQIAGINLAAQAMRIDTAQVPQDMLDILSQTVQKTGPQVRQGNTEVLAWQADGKRVAQIQTQVGNQLKQAGWQYEEIKADNGMTILMASRKTPTRKGLMGYWIPTKASKVLWLMWTEMLPNTEAAPAEGGFETPAPRPRNQTPSRAISKSVLNGYAFPAGTRTVADADFDTEAVTSLDSLLAEWLPAIHDKQNLRPVASTLEVVEWSGGLSKQEFDDSLRDGGFVTLGFLKDNANPNRSFLYFVRNPKNEGEVRREFCALWIEGDKTRLAWLEIKPGGDADAVTPDPAKDRGPDFETPAPRPRVQPAALTPAAPSASVIEVGPNQRVVNVMKNALPKLPTFTALATKPNFVRGYVKDTSGKPIVGATIGVRSSSAGGFTSGAKGKTDAKGYYEIQAPWGAGEFYNAGYTMDYGDSRAAFGLYPADGEADSFATAKGHVENWVLLPYGVANRDNAADQPQFPGNYYGGSLYVNYFNADPRFGPSEDLPVGATVEVTLTPQGKLIDGSQGRSFTLRQQVSDGVALGFLATNIPVGTYRMSARLVNGKALKMRDNSSKEYGLEPKTANGSASLTFRAGHAASDMVAPQHSDWESVNVRLTQ